METTGISPTYHPSESPQHRLLARPRVPYATVV